MKAACDFKQQRLRRLQRYPRRELASPGGYRRKSFPFRLRQRMPVRQRLAAELRKVERDPVHARAFRQEEPEEPPEACPVA